MPGFWPRGFATTPDAQDPPDATGAAIIRAALDFARELRAQAEADDPPLEINRVDHPSPEPLYVPDLPEWDNADLNFRLHGWHGKLPPLPWGRRNLENELGRLSRERWAA